MKPVVLNSHNNYYNNIYAYNNWMLPSKLLNRLYDESMYSTFFEDARTLVANLEVIFTNIVLLARGTCVEINTTDLIIKFLRLLNHILDRWQVFPQNKDKLDKLRLSEILWILLNGAKADCYLISVNEVLRRILENFCIEDALQPVLDLFKECLQKSMENDLFQEVCFLVITVIKLNFHNEAIAALDWILANLDQFIFSITDVSWDQQSLLTALQCLQEFYKIPICHESISNKLFPHTSSILTLCCCNSIKKQSRAILSEMIFDFAAFINNPWKETYGSLPSLVEALPDTLDCWHTSGNDIFFVIALMIDTDMVLWKWPLEQITNAIVERVEKPEIIIPPVLKGMCVFFSKSVILYKNCFKATSCRLINKLECSGTFYEIVTSSKSQLVWILKSTASESTKFMALTMWLKEEMLIKDLVKILTHFDMEEVLLDYIQKFPTNPLSKRAAIAISKIKNSALSKKITVTLFQNLSCMNLCSLLLLAKPAIPSNKEQSMALCTVLGAILPHLQDKDAFVATCDWSSNLLISLKDHKPHAVVSFCQNINNVRVIFGAAVSCDDNVGLAALKLLKKLLELQVRNNVDFQHTIKTNLSHLVKGTDLRKKIALSLIKTIVRFRQNRALYLNYSDDMSLSIYQKLHDFCGTELADVSYKCMLRMLQGDPDYLKFSAVTYALMDMQCNYPQSCAKSTSFLQFAKYWLEQMEFADIFDLPPTMKESLLLRENSINNKS